MNPGMRHGMGEGHGSDLISRVQELLAGLVAGQSLQAGESPVGSPAPRVLDAASPRFAETVNRLATMTLDRFAREGQPLEVRVPWLEVTLWFVPRSGTPRRSSGPAPAVVACGRRAN